MNELNAKARALVNVLRAQGSPVRVIEDGGRFFQRSMTEECYEIRFRHSKAIQRMALFKVTPKTTPEELETGFWASVAAIASLPRLMMYVDAYPADLDESAGEWTVNAVIEDVEGREERVLMGMKRDQALHVQAMLYEVANALQRSQMRTDVGRSGTRLPPRTSDE